MTTLLLELPGVPPSLSNLRAHHMALHRLKTDWKRSAHFLGLAARNQAGWGAAGEGERRTVVITMHRTHLLDPDNAAASVKAIVDGLKTRQGRGVFQRVGAGLIADDSPELLTLVVDQIKVRRKADEKTVIEVGRVHEAA